MAYPRDPLEALGPAFDLGTLEAAEPLGSGHIHRTWLASWRRDGALRRYVHQRLNTRVFTQPERLMTNLERVTDHLRAALARRGTPDPERRTLCFARTTSGRALHVDASGDCWRTTPFVEGTRCLQRVESPAQAEQAGYAFGHFAALLVDLGPPRLEDTIPHFHDLPRRVEAFEQAAARDARGRAGACGAELASARALADAVLPLLSREADALPRRVVHNDCKLNNLLLDARTGEGLCVVDLDTVMEGTVLADFGELVRTGANPAAEDERDLSKVVLDLGLVEALARGYLRGTRPFLGEAERQALPLAGLVLTLENAVRFLADHLDGDRYFPAHREGHNLDRARTQLRLAEQLQDALPTLRARLASLAAGS